ncbi:MAG: hypothetical protein ABSG89_01610 [Bacteroidales bacterium]|jgi:hypothetical protein
MKTLNFKKAEDIFVEFALNFDEMLKVRGGTDNPVILPVIPSPKI